MPKSIKPLAKDSYIECEACSEEEGEVVIYHQSALRKETGFWSDGEMTTCPRGHEMPGVKK